MFPRNAAAVSRFSQYQFAAWTLRPRVRKDQFTVPAPLRFISVSSHRRVPAHPPTRLLSARKGAGVSGEMTFFNFRAQSLGTRKGGGNKTLPPAGCPPPRAAQAHLHGSYFKAFPRVLRPGCLDDATPTGNTSKFLLVFCRDNPLVVTRFRVERVCWCAHL